MLVVRGRRKRPSWAGLGNRLVSEDQSSVFYFVLHDDGILFHLQLVREWQKHIVVDVAGNGCEGV